MKVPPASRDLEHVRQLLDDPSLRRVFFVRNGPGSQADQQVASVIERTTRYGFFKLTVSQGIVIDPRHPEEAMVYAVVVNPEELGSLREQLNLVLRDRVEETPADPGIATQLADIRAGRAHPAFPDHGGLDPPRGSRAPHAAFRRDGEQRTAGRGRRSSRTRFGGRR